MDFFFVSVVGLVLGSFLNVVICRLPLGRSLAWPGSHCSNCKTPIKAYDNIPLLSYVWLKGRCRHCRQKIGIQYPLVEAMTAFFLVLAYRFRGPTALFLFDSLLVCTFIPIFFIDLRHQIIPNGLNIVLALGALGPLFLGEVSLKQALLGLLVGGGVLFVIALIGPMGGGDIKFMGAMGLWLGPLPTVLALWIAFVTGGLVGGFLLLFKIKKRKDAIAFGPYLILGSVLAYFFHDFLFYAYQVHFL